MNEPPETIKTPPTPPEPPPWRTKRDSDGDTIVKASASVNLKWPHIIAILGALGVGGGALTYTAVRADDNASEAKSKVEIVEKTATDAAKGAAEDHAATKEKLDPTAGAVTKLRDDVNFLLRIESERQERRERMAGRRARRVVVPAPAPVPPEVKEPLPPTAAPAAKETP